MFLYCKTKGEIEETLKKMEFENLSIFHPGLLLNRDNDQRLGEKILKYFPIPKIEAKDMAKAMRIETELLIEKKNSEIKNQIFIYNNDQIKNIAKSKL